MGNFSVFALAIDCYSHRITACDRERGKRSWSIYCWLCAINEFYWSTYSTNRIATTRLLALWKNDRSQTKAILHSKYPFLKKKNLISDCDDDFEVVSNWMIAVCVCVVLTDRYNGVCLLMRSKCLRSISFWAKVIYNFYCSYSISKTSRVLSFSSYIAYQSTFAVTDAQHQLIKRSCAILVGRRVASIQQ